MMNEKKNEAEAVSELLTVVRRLRGEGGCPWDIEQDHHSIRKGMIEECYEVVEAIDRDDTALLREELGDVLLQIVFHSDMEKDAGNFNITDVANDECVKMIHRHPHVFGQVKADTSEQVLANWEVIKTEEKQRVSLSDQLQAIPPILPALMRASKVAKKMGRCADAKPDELLFALQAQITSIQKNQGKENFDATAQVGALLARVVDLSRAFNVDAELALSKNTDRLIDSVSESD